MSERFVACAAEPDGCEGSLLVRVGAASVELVEGGDPEGFFVGVLDGRSVWATDAEPDDGAGVALMGLWGAVDEVTWTVAGRAVQIVEWDRTHRYCGRCAAPTVEVVEESRARRCPGCGLLAFPRLAPAVIVLITRDDGRALLARGAAFPIPMWSCLAGFVEPGETLEEAVHREVGEEVGLQLRDVRYWGSQPWPFPHSLMLGFTARWAGGEIRCDTTEIAEADWYPPDRLPPIPPGMSIARRMIDAWVGGAAGR